jgi:hypothetical protein
MNDKELKNQLGELINLAIDCMGVAVTIIDANGTFLNSNQHSAKNFILNLDYIRTDILTHIKKAYLKCSLTFLEIN